MDRRTASIALALTVLAVTLPVLVNDGAAQTRTADIIVTTNATVWPQGENVTIQAQPVDGDPSSPTWSWVNPDNVRYALTAATQRSNVGACWDFGNKTWEETNVFPDRCRQPFEDTTSSLVTDELQAPAPLPADTPGYEGDQSPIKVAVFGAVDIGVSGEYATGDAPAWVMTPDRYETFGHFPTDMTRYAGFNALELAFFVGTSILGAVIWSRSLDPGVRAFGASLPMIAGALMLGFGAHEGFGAVWEGTVAFSSVLILVGLYMFIRLFFDILAGTPETQGGPA